MIIRFCKRHASIFIGIVLFLIPNIFWGNLYEIGGDDTRLYYLFPWEFITKFARHIVVDNVFGIRSDYYSSAFFIPFMTLMVFVKAVAPHIHIQHFFMGLNLAAGFFFFGLLIKRFMQNNSKKEEIATIGGLSYIFSNFLIYTVYTHQLLSIYLVSVIPTMLYFFIKGIQEKRVIYTLIASLIYSIFSTGMNTIPWFAGVILVFLPFFFYLLCLYGKEFIRHAFTLFISTILLNAYWIIHFIYPLVSKNASMGGLVGVSNENFLEGTIDLVQSVSRLNSPLNVFFNTVRASWATVPSYNVLFNMGGITFLFIVSMGFLLRQSKYKNIYVICFISLLFSFFFLSPSFGIWSVNLYVWLVRYVPMFTIFRNMYDKFSIAVALWYALSLSISLIILSEKKVGKTVWYSLVSLLLILPLINAIPFIFPRYNDVRYSTRVSGVFNKNYQELVSYIQSANDPSRYLWLPLNLANYVYLSDELPGHYYFGPSPLLLLTGATDFTGFLSFGTVFDHSTATQLEDLLISKDYQKIGAFFQRYNINYVIFNNEGLVSEKKQYLFGLNLLELQNEELLHAILGSKIKDFGDRYSLYHIAPQFSSHKIYIRDDTSVNLEFIKKDSYVFDFKLPISDVDTQLVFLETYNRDWEVQAVSASKQILLAKSEIEQEPYENTFVIHPSDIQALPRDMLIQEGDLNFVRARLYFGPQKYTIIGSVISLSTGILIVIAISISLLKWKKETSI